MGFGVYVVCNLNCSQFCNLLHVGAPVRHRSLGNALSPAHRVAVDFGAPSRVPVARQDDRPRLPCRMEFLRDLIFAILPSVPIKELPHSKLSHFSFFMPWAEQTS